MGQPGVSSGVISLSCTVTVTSPGTSIPIFSPGKNDVGLTVGYNTVTLLIAQLQVALDMGDLHAPKHRIPLIEAVLGCLGVVCDLGIVTEPTGAGEALARVCEWLLLPGTAEGGLQLLAPCCVALRYFVVHTTGYACAATAPSSVPAPHLIQRPQHVPDKRKTPRVIPEVAPAAALTARVGVGPNPREQGCKLTNFSVSAVSSHFARFAVGDWWCVVFNNGVGRGLLLRVL